MRTLWWGWSVVLAGAAALALPGAALSQDCGSCHAGQVSLAGSIHEDMECMDCHAGGEDVDHPENPLPPVDCAMCHDDAAAANARGIHGQARAAGMSEAAGCADCHGTHDIRPASDPQSRVHPLNVALTCARCHADPQLVQKYEIPIPNPLAAYEKSIHGVAVLGEGHTEAAVCTSCHGAHDILPMTDPASPIYWSNVPDTCGRCHTAIEKDYAVSVHGRAVRAGVHDAPVCTDCHGEHGIRPTEDRDAAVHPLRVSRETCGRCHASERLAEKFGIPVDRVRTFRDSYHGLATRSGATEAANCASCHGIHKILPSSDPRSSVYPANLQRTCGSCHPGAGERFASGPVHLATTSGPGRIVEMVRRIYVGLIVVVIGGMFLHNAFDFRVRAREVLEGRVET